MTRGYEDRVRQWFAWGKDQGALALFILEEASEGPPYPHLAMNRAEYLYTLSEISRAPHCKVVEIFEIAGDLEAQLNQAVAWYIP